MRIPPYHHIFDVLHSPRASLPVPAAMMATQDPGMPDAGNETLPAPGNETQSTPAEPPCSGTRAAGVAGPILLGPSGLGTNGYRFIAAIDRASAACDEEPPRTIALEQRPIPTRTDIFAPLPYTERQWGDGSHSPLYLPPTVRIDEELGEEVNRRLVEWAATVGLHEGRLDHFRDTGFGRLAMLTHADSNDPDMLLIAAKMNAAWWAADDYYADDTTLGATPTELPPRLATVMSAIDPPAYLGPYVRSLDETVAADPVLVALKSATEYLGRYAAPDQVMRARNATAQMYVSWTAYAAWRYLRQPPPVWRYLAARYHDNFYTSMTLIDVVGRYELMGNLFYQKEVQGALNLAGMAAVLVNDLYSAAREAADEMPDSNAVLLMAAEENLTLNEATERTVALHNDFVTAFETRRRSLAAVGSIELQRFLRGAQAWMGGSFEWHSATARYRSYDSSIGSTVPMRGSMP